MGRGGGRELALVAGGGRGKGFFFFCHLLFLPLEDPDVGTVEWGALFSGV